MKLIIRYMILPLAFAAFAGCSSKDIQGYEPDPGLFFQIPGSGSVALRDSIIYSFPAKPDVGDHDTLWFKACIMGNAASFDREIGIRINADKTTAVEGTHFRIEGRKMPADSFSVRVPVIIYKNGLKDKSVRLEIEVTENQYFKPGYERYKKAVFIWGDMFLKPDIWDKSNYRSAFGEFTPTRYAFILQACNITELPDPMNLTLLAYYNSVVRKALFDRNAIPGNTPLTDELGTVEFPVYTGVGGLG